jgi:hypothetical protein
MKDNIAGAESMLGKLGEPAAAKTPYADNPLADAVQTGDYTGPTQDTAGKVSDYVSTPDAVAGDSYITPLGTVSGQMEKLMAEDSQMSEMARKRAEEMANRKGMLGSSMAIGAVNAAQYEAAQKVAEKDAATYSSAELEQQKEQGLLNQTGYEADVTESLKAFEAEIAAGQNEQQNSFTMGVEEFKASENWNTLVEQIASNEKMSSQDAAVRLTQTMIDVTEKFAVADAKLAADIAVEYDKMDLEQRRHFEDTSSTMFRDYNNDIQIISSLTDDQMSPSDKRAWIADRGETLANQTKFLASLSGAEVTVDDYDSISNTYDTRGAREVPADVGGGERDVAPEPTRAGEAWSRNFIARK